MKMKAVAVRTFRLTVFCLSWQWRRQAESAGKKGEGDSEVDVGTSSSRPIMSKKVDADVESHGPAAHDAVPLPVAGQQKDVHHVKEEEPVVETPR
jgi:hypothetical protein